MYQCQCFAINSSIFECNDKCETQNAEPDSLELTGLAKPGKTRRLMGTRPGLAHQESASQVFGRVWKQTDPFLQSKP
jgi:hypothetical protein